MVDDIDSILTKLENEVARDVTKRVTQHSSGRSPRSSHTSKFGVLNILDV